jgi:hypothetical protein
LAEQRNATIVRFRVDTKVMVVSGREE